MDFLYIDVLPLRTAEEVGGFSTEATRQRGLALAVTWDAQNQFRSFASAARRELILAMQASGCVVGYNCEAFDFEIIDYRPPKHCDLFAAIAKATGQPVALSNVFRDFGTRPVLSSGNRLTARWRAGKRDEVITAFRRHVGAIRRIHQHILEEGWILYRDMDASTKGVRIELNR